MIRVDFQTDYMRSTKIYDGTSTVLNEVKEKSIYDGGFIWDLMHQEKNIKIVKH